MARIKFKQWFRRDDTPRAQDLQDRRPQRKFLKLVLEKTSCISLRELINRGFDVPYSTLKNYFNESRTLPENLFNELCVFANISKKDLNIEILKENWGQAKGGKTSKRKLFP